EGVGDLLYRLAYFVEAADDHQVGGKGLTGAGTTGAMGHDLGDLYEITPERLVGAGVIGKAGLGSFGIDTSGDVVAMIARPYDNTIAVAHEGPPAPFGTVPFGATDFTSHGAESAVHASDVGYDSRSSDSPASMPFL